MYLALGSMKTKDKILKASLELFNDQGERNVSTNHIAAKLGISPGNLYYHFRNKQEIIHQLFLQYQAEVQGFMGVPQDRTVTFQDKVKYMEDILNSMWDYRFLHRDLQHIMQEDEALRNAYRAFSSRTVSDGRYILEKMVESGILNATPEQLDALILNIWIIVVSWSSFLQSIAIQTNHSGTVSKDMLKRAIYQIIAMEEPYVCESIRPLIPAFKKRYLMNGTTDPLAMFPVALPEVESSR